MAGPVIFLLAGVLCGKFLFPEALTSGLDPAITISLSIIVFCAGADIGSKRIIFQKLREYKGKALLYPFVIAAGSIIGGILAAIALGMPAREGGAIGAGLGYYSLSSGLLTELGGVSLGSLSFTVNVLREAFSLLFIPVIARFLGYHTAIAPAGAASMDTALGVIARCTDEETALLAMVSGVVLTIAVPILVPLAYQYL